MNHKIELLINSGVCQLNSFVITVYCRYICEGYHPITFYYMYFKFLCSINNN